jgi:hypothetical protein
MAGKGRGRDGEMGVMSRKLENEFLKQQNSN